MKQHGRFQSNDPVNDEDLVTKGYGDANYGGSSGGGVSMIQETFDYTDFVDDGNGNYIVTFSDALPPEAVPVGAIFQINSQFDAGYYIVIGDWDNGGNPNNYLTSQLVSDAVAGTYTTTSGEPQGNGIYDFTTYPNPILFFQGGMPTQGNITATLLYTTGAGGGGSDTVIATDRIDLTAQVADISATTFTGSGVGTYEVFYELIATTADLTAGTVQLSITYNDATGRTDQSSTVALTIANTRDRGSFFIVNDSGDIQYAVGHTGIFGSAEYRLVLDLVRLS